MFRGNLSAIYGLFTKSVASVSAVYSQLERAANLNDTFGLNAPG
jgi:hypothetical protein